MLDLGAGYADVLTLFEGAVGSMNSAEGATSGARTAVMLSPPGTGKVYGRYEYYGKCASVAV